MKNTPHHIYSQSPSPRPFNNVLLPKPTLWKAHKLVIQEDLLWANHFRTDETSDTKLSIQLLRDFFMFKIRIAEMRNRSLNFTIEIHIRILINILWIWKTLMILKPNNIGVDNIFSPGSKSRCRTKLYGYCVRLIHWYMNVS